MIDDGTWTTSGHPPSPYWTTVGGGAGCFNPDTTQMNDQPPKIEAFESSRLSRKR